MNYKFDFVKHRKAYYLFSALLTLVGFISLIFAGFNLGVDFQSGTRLEIFLGQPFHEEELAAELKSLGLEPGSVVTAGDDDQRAVVRFAKMLGKEEIAKVRSHLQETYGTQIDIQESTVDPIVSRELAKKAAYSVLLASLGIVLYVTIRFEIRFAIAAIIALLHDAFVVMTVFSLFRIEIDLPFIAAILTIVGYSINDTIVIFDRIRENLRTAKVKAFDDLAAVVNESLNQTLARSINTVLTVVFAAAALLLFGGPSIRNFSLAMLIGLVSGAYSSIFIASQIWLDWKGRELKKNRASFARHEAS
ncbi:hypothetical protein BSNK01_03450 [Bacillaceae bacterium]